MKISDAQSTSLLLVEQAAAPATPAAGLARVFAKADGLYFIDDAGAVMGPFGTSGPAAAGSLIAYKQYDPATAVTYPTTTTAAAVDTTNLRVPFTVPASGSVLVVLSSRVNVASRDFYWTLFSGGAQVADAEEHVVYDNGADASRYSYRRVFSGLTPGASLTWDWAFRHAGAGSTSSLLVGGDHGAALMEVWAAP